MTLEEISYIGEIIAAVAVIASLIFVGTQLRQNTRAMRIAAGQAMVTIWGATNRDLFDNDDLLREVTLGFSESDSQDALRATRTRFWMGNALRQGEFNYFNWKAGDLDEHYWTQTNRALALVLAVDFGRDAWESLRQLHSDEFVAVMDKHVAAGLAAAETAPLSGPAESAAKEGELSATVGD